MKADAAREADAARGADAAQEAVNAGAGAGQKSKPNLEGAGGRLRMGRYAIITPKPESAARGTLVRPAPTQGAAGLDKGSRKVQPAATKAASKVQPAATKAEPGKCGRPATHWSLAVDLFGVCRKLGTPMSTSARPATGERSRTWKYSGSRGVVGVTMNLEDAVTSRRLTKTVCAKTLESCQKSMRRLRGDDASADDG